MKTTQIKKSMTLILALVLLLLCSCGTYSYRSGSHDVSFVSADKRNIDLSDEYDHILCKGTDTSGNVYELVAKQMETASSVTIEMGIIKNNSWLEPMSKSFPFITTYEDAGLSFGDLAETGRRNKLIREIWFVDSGAFLLEYPVYNDLVYNHNACIIYSCASNKTLKIDPFDDIDSGNKFFGTFTRNEYISANISNGSVFSYGELLTCDGVLTMVEVHADYNNDSYDCYLLNPSDFSKSYLSKNLSSPNEARGPFSEGLILYYDNIFYDKNRTPVIDLNSLGYSIWSLGSCRFINGQFTFIVTNSIGSRYQITIDRTGQVISEEKI